MKKVTRIIGAICMMGLLTFVSTSCKKEKENGEMTINVVVSEFEEDGERAYIDQYKKFWWHENDYIRVFNLAEEDEEGNTDESATSIFSKIGNDAPAQTARFRGPSVGSKKFYGYRIFYPVDMIPGTAEEINTNLWKENRATFQVFDHQQYEAYETPDHHFSLVDGNAMPLAVQTEQLTQDVTLRQMFGVASFEISAGVNETIVVDSVKLTSIGHNITGKASVRLHDVDADALLLACNKFFAEPYQAFSEDYLNQVLRPTLGGIGWRPSEGGDYIIMDCRYEQNDEVKGVQLQQFPNITAFNFLLRPLALCDGFNLTLYIHDSEPVELTYNSFKYNDASLNYDWAVRPKKIKRYKLNDPISLL